ncbi:transporter substrate-binding domain-containing protein [Mediterraneibacter agrestimuris]|uniref:transporter substrate-binding domain-containing protein n=1 Tax=Mediterraneibacter agrestimuris TaxID=2941333 RepID=UPI00203DBCE9|nr:transporter substrate-binding domain-containing protein [Mediterraneibacter agrestimuris]
MKKKLLGLILSGFLVFLAVISGCGSAGQGKGTLTVGVRDDIMNFGYLNEKTGNFYGLEIDIAREMAERLGFTEVKFAAVKPENRKQTLLDEEVDCLIAAYSITDTRIKNFDFSPAYYTDITQIMVENSTGFEKINQLKGKTIGVMNGANTGPELAIKLYEMGIISDDTFSDSDLETVYDNLTIRKIPSYAKLSEALETGEVDAVCMDGCISQTYLTDSRVLLDGSIHEQQYGVATNKGSELSQPISDTIQKMLDDGTIDILIDKWD